MDGLSLHWARLTRAAVLVLSAIVVLPAFATNLTGTFKNPDGSLVNGKLIFLLSQPGKLSDNSAQIVPMVKIFSVTSGMLEAGAFIYGNDVLIPQGTYYLVRLVDTNNNLLFEQKWSIQGTSLDLGTLTPTTTGVVLADPLVKNTGANQSVQGPVTFSSGLTALNLTLSGNLTPATADSYDLGATAAPWRQLIAKELVLKGPRPWYDVRAYGAVGDGSTDDRTAIQAAIDLCQANGGGGYVYFSPSPTFNYYRILSALTLTTPPQNRNCVLLLGNSIHINGDLVVPPGWHIEGVAGGLNGAAAFAADLHSRIVGEPGTFTEAILKLNAASGTSIQNVQLQWNGTSDNTMIYVKGGAGITFRNVFATVSATDATNIALKIEGPALDVFFYNCAFGSSNQFPSAPSVDIYGVPGQTNAGGIYFYDTKIFHHGIRNRAGGNGAFGGLMLVNVLHQTQASATVMVDSTASSGARWTFIQCDASDLIASTGQPVWEHTAGTFPVSELTFIGCREPQGAGYYKDEVATLAARVTNVTIIGMQNGVNLRPVHDRFRSGNLPRQGWGASILTATPSKTFVSGWGLAGAQVTVGMQYPENVAVTCFTTGGTLAAGNYSYVVTALNGVNSPHDNGVTVSSGTPYESWISAEVTGNVASGTTGRCDLTWDSVIGAVNYRVYGRGAYISNQGVHNKTIFFPATTGSFSDTGGAGTAGSPPKWDSESGNAPIHRLTAIADNWIGGTKNLGIGTYAPAAKLHVVQPATATVGFRLDAAATPSANLFEVYDSAAALKARITSTFAAEFQSLTLLASPLGLSSGGTGQISWTPNRCVRVNSVGTALEAASGDCGVGGGGGDNVSVNGTAATDTDLVNQAATGTVPAATWSLNTTPSPDEISLTVGPASATAAGVVTTGTQTFDGAKTFKNSIVAKLFHNIVMADSPEFAGADICASIQNALTALSGADGIVDARGFVGDFTCTGGWTVTRGATLLMGTVQITVGATVTQHQWSHIMGVGTDPSFYKSTVLIAKNNLDAPVLRCVSDAGPSEWCHGATIQNIRIQGNKANQSLLTIAAAPTGASRASNVVTITTTAAHGFTTGQVAIVRGVADTTFNGFFTIQSTPTTTTFTYNQVGSDITSGSGTTNAKEADCIQVERPGENFLISRVHVNDCRHSGLRIRGNMAGANRIESAAVFSSGIGINFDEVSSTNVGEVWKGDDNELFLRVKPVGGGGGVVINARKIQAENATAVSHEPMILLDGADSGGQIYVEGLYPGGPPVHNDIIKTQGGNFWQIGIRALHASTASYTNLINDTSHPGGTRVVKVADLADGFGLVQLANYSFFIGNVFDGWTSWPHEDRTVNNGTNNNWTAGFSGGYTHVRMTGATAEFGFSGISVGGNPAVCGTNCVQEGRILVIHNPTSHNMYFEHENTGSNDIHRIVTKTGGRLNVGPSSIAWLIYSKSDNRWHLMNDPYSATVTASLTTAMRDSDGDLLARQLESTATGGTAPLLVASTIEVTNLNSQLWHGKQAIDYSASLDFSPIAAQACSELSVSVTGASIGNAVAPVWPATLESGLTGVMYVSSTDTIKVRLCNVTSSSVDPANQTFGSRLIK